jgi:hypothetical protein
MENLNNLKPVLNWEHKYAVSEEGKVYNILNPDDIKPVHLSVSSKSKYALVLFHEKIATKLYKKELKSVHRVVWEAYNGAIPESHWVTFNDKNTLNCNINNLSLKKASDVRRGKTAKPVYAIKVDPTAKPTDRPIQIKFPSAVEAAKYLRISSGNIPKIIDTDHVVGYKLYTLK